MVLIGSAAPSMRLSLPILSQMTLTSNPRRIIASIWLMTKVCDKSGNSPTTKPIFMAVQMLARAGDVPARLSLRDRGRLGVDGSPGPGGGAVQDVEERRELMLRIELRAASE